MTLELTPEQLDVLLRILTEYRGSLRSEIYRTEDGGYKRDLKHEEDLIDELFRRIQARAVAA
jgi:hypothetical protein